MPINIQNSEQTARLATFVCTDAGARSVRAAIERAGLGDAVIHGGGLGGAARVSAERPVASKIIAEMGQISLSMACEYVTALCDNGADVIVLGEHDDIETYRALRRAGASEYFAMPVEAEDILNVEPAPRPSAQVLQMPQPRATAPSIAVVGSCGGVGASLLSQSLAVDFAGTKSKSLRTALIDADLEFGSQAVTLDRDGTAGLFEALSAPERVDGTFLAATMEEIGDQLFLYSGQSRAGQNTLALEAGLPPLYTRLRREFDAVVTDLPRSVLMRDPQIAELFDALLLVVPAGFAGVNAASRLMSRIGAEAPDVRVHVVLSEVRSDAKLSSKAVQKALGVDAVAVLPRADRQIVRAQRAGRPLLECVPRSAYAKAVRKISSAATTPPSPAGKTSGRPSLLRRFGK
ncbi:hypothetical protein [Roseivivax sp. THAF30]|jgi:pilus assembly protein CpaE|uniref:AAA family ATPase n=1 Tax=Roseivivax sp. THAF30 TaxID=2587852 RepID=UPI0012682835|nr:hypothetical protein [Roseivivax sp. THAF30]QFT61589.1 hypothetical protein FIU91_01505 [Roseivivax sp. THAF30]